MPKFRTKPAVIEAVQWVPGQAVEGVCTLTYAGCLPESHVHTAHAGQAVALDEGDWIIPEPDGRGHYPCTPDIFAARYEEADAMRVLDEIAAERRRQVESEGYSPEHDDAHEEGELADAAAAYCLVSTAAGGQNRGGANRGSLARNVWPWTRSSFTPQGARRNLIRAAALLVAEIERLDRTANAARERELETA